MRVSRISTMLFSGRPLDELPKFDRVQVGDRVKLLAVARPLQDVVTVPRWRGRDVDWRFVIEAARDGVDDALPSAVEEDGNGPQT